MSVLPDITRWPKKWYTFSGYVSRISEADLETIDETNYSATTHIGKSGVERARETVLHGQVGYQRVEVNAQGRSCGSSNARHRWRVRTST